MSANLHLLIIGYVWPEPASSAAGTRMLQLIKLFLSQHWKITFASAAVLSSHRFDLTALGIEEKIILLNDSSFDEYLRQTKPEMVLFDRFFTEEQFGWRVEKNCPAAIRILDTEDLHSLRHARHQLLKMSQQGAVNEKSRQGVDPVLANAKELYRVMAGDDMAQREIAAIYRCDLSLIISEFETSFLQEYFHVPAQLLFYCPFLAPPEVDKAALPGCSQRQHFIAIGNFRHEPNWDSVLYLKHSIWPRMRGLLKSAGMETVELHIYGAYPPPKAAQLHQPKDNFFIKGWADDAISVMSRARVCLAPLRFGAGIKGKLMDAMSSGTPGVTTDIGAESMYGNATLWCGCIANNADEFARAAVQLYQDESAWYQAQANGFAILENFFGGEDYAGNLLIRIDRLRKNCGAERLNNFTGSMLRHHLHKSTQYMSQWIEAKNRSKEQ